MHIKHIHETLERLSEIACAEVSKSVECIDTCELGAVIDMVKDLSKAEYYSIISKEMKKAEEEDEAEEKHMLKSLKEEYGEDEGKRYYDMWRYKSGRFAPKGRGTRRGYDEPPYYHMNPDMYREHDPEYYRDMDRENGRLYFSEPITTESRYDKAKRMYTETKAKHNTGSVEDKQLTLKEGEKMLNVIIDELMEMVNDATPEMKNMIKTKGMAAMQKIQ